VIWAISWPAVKAGIATIPPIWYACFRYWIATLSLFVFGAVRHDVTLPPRSDWRLVAVSGVLQMATYSVLTGLALTILPPGRASVLAFSTPIWVVPLAAWWLREHASRRALCGVGLGILGVLTIAAPSLRPDGAEQALAYAMLLGAAAAWAVSIVVVRAHRFTATALALAPWQMLVAGCVLLPFALLVEGAPQPIGLSGAVSLAYVGPLATAFAYWAVVEVGRRISARALSMALLAAPCLGSMISAITFGETIGVSLVAGVTLVGVGVRLATGAPLR
jgi:drug/metabolite transporter (DMT)-like permease